MNATMVSEPKALLDDTAERRSEELFEQQVYHAGPGSLALAYAEMDRSSLEPLSRAA